MALPNNILDLTPTDFCGKQVMGFSEVFYTKVYEDPQLNELLTVIPGVKAKQQVIVLGLIGLVGKTMQTINCAPDVSNQEIPAIQKFYDPAYIEDRFTECWKNLLPKFAAWGLKNGIQKPDLTGTDFANFLEDAVIYGLGQAILRIVWFAESAASDFTAGGHFEDALDLRYVNAIDGLWAQFYAIAAATPARRITIVKNAAATYALQKFDAADVTNQVITGYFQEMVDSMDERMIGDTGLAFYVTKSVMSQYKKERRAFSNIDQAYTRTEAGFDSLEFDGIPVIALNFQDRFIKQFLSNGTKAYQPHRIYLANKENLHLATEEENGMKDVESFYDQKDKQFYIDTLFSVDALVVEDYKIMLAY